APRDIATQLGRIEAAAPGGLAPIVMSDVEGGSVERAANLLGAMPSARELAQAMSPPQVQAFARSAGRRMRAIGLTMDLAPVADLDAGDGPTPSNPDGTRSFSADPLVAAADATAFATGLAAAGVVPVIKHFPGLHGAGDNTDVGPAQTSPWSALQQRGKVPFRAAIDGGIPAVMLSNASVPGLSSLPSSLSASVVSVLRDQLGFRGLILTDSLTAGAIAGIGLGLATASVDALVAGADMVIYSSNAPAAGGVVAAITAAVASGRLPREQLVHSAARVLAVKRVDLCAG
nr:glycoside hydrolase family 3 protein [Candidatus Dormibacteraeota bacterium]